jgi:COP9 signalosome complex subunit 3
MTKCYNSVVSILDHDILEVDTHTRSFGVTAKDYLLYFYHGGMIYIGLKNFSRALEFFKLALTIPAVVTSHIMLESFKKYILISLLVNGNVESLPRYSSPIVSRMKTLLQPYQEFATAFSTNSTDDLHKCAQTHMDLFKKEKNFGLIKQCIQSLYRRNIQRLTLTYITFSLPDIAETVQLASPKAAELSILKMIEGGEIFAKINQKDGMVSFHENPEKYDTNNTVGSLDKSLRDTMALVQKIKLIEEEIATSQEYIQKTLAHERPARFDDDVMDIVMAEKGGMRG